jgi:hypothetical protein
MSIMPRWTKGVSGNLRGRPKRNYTFTDALRAKGSPHELAELAWKAARDGQPWAIQMIYNRLDPKPAQLKLMTEERDENPIDYSRLTDMEVRELQGLLDKAAARPDKAAA